MPSGPGPFPLAVLNHGATHISPSNRGTRYRYPPATMASAGVEACIDATAVALAVPTIMTSLPSRAALHVTAPAVAASRDLVIYASGGSAEVNYAVL